MIDIAACRRHFVSSVFAMPVAAYSACPAASQILAACGPFALPAAPMAAGRRAAKPPAASCRSRTVAATPPPTAVATSGGAAPDFDGFVDDSRSVCTMSAHQVHLHLTLPCSPGSADNERC